MSEESTSNIEICLRKLQEAANLFTPRCVMVDKDIKEINTIKAVSSFSSTYYAGFMCFRLYTGGLLGVMEVT
ncbi:hypothetical protein AMEX_G19017 [Astyanax mexicanus]|uniref:Uncharacterized protein n=1 Tax=Astyanax mexicanus TaxID=7994 RepID=A0A8T2L8Q4_ASTMX|nr:hypothetical protein AMEX_G19017 [Astyanax mexicanus]